MSNPKSRPQNDGGVEAEIKRSEDPSALTYLKASLSPIYPLLLLAASTFCRPQTKSRGFVDELRTDRGQGIEGALLLRRPSSLEASHDGVERALGYKGKTVFL